MHTNRLVEIVFGIAILLSAGTLFGRGFGGFHGGGFGGGGVGGGRLGGGGLGGGLGGGGFGGGRLGGGGLGGGLGGGRLGGGGLGGGLGSGGLGGDRLGAGGLGGDRGAFGGAGGEGLGGMRGFEGAGPSASRLSSFLGLPTDSGMSHAGSMEHPFGYSGSARGLSAFNPTAAGGAAGKRGAVAGPEGAAAGQAGAAGGVYHGPGGTTIAHGTAGARGVAVGPEGAAAGARVASGTVVKGPEGNVYARGGTAERGVVAGPEGVAGGARVAGGAAVRGPAGNVYARGGSVTRKWSAADLHVQGNYVRGDFHDYGAFDRDWYARYPGAWYTRGFVAGAWTVATWPRINTWFGTAWPAVAYNYGNDVTYVGNEVYLYGEPIATTQDYWQSASDLAAQGEQASVKPDEQWLPLGVFEAIPAGEKSSKMTFEIAVNKAGIVRGNYYNPGDKNVQPIEGAVDKQTQRITWVVKDKKDIIFDTGLYNLTKNETVVLVHFSKDKTEQWTLVRLKQPAGAAPKQ